MRIAVYQYQVLEGNARTRVRSTTYRTRESIEQRGGKVLEDTARKVPAMELDGSGLWRPDRNPVT